MTSVQLTLPNVVAPTTTYTLTLPSYTPAISLTFDVNMDEAMSAPENGVRRSLPTKIYGRKRDTTISSSSSTVTTLDSSVLADRTRGDTKSSLRPMFNSRDGEILDFGWKNKIKFCDAEDSDNSGMDDPKSSPVDLPPDDSMDNSLFDETLVDSSQTAAESSPPLPQRKTGAKQRKVVCSDNEDEDANMKGPLPSNIKPSRFSKKRLPTMASDSEDNNDLLPPVDIQITRPSVSPSVERSLDRDDKPSAPKKMKSKASDKGITKSGKVKVCHQFVSIRLFV